MSVADSITKISGRAVPLRGANIDTDRIIPARYLKVTRFDTLGEAAFYDARFSADGKMLDHPLNDERYKGGNILIVQSNFGSGSSREHAPQSLMRYGFQAFVGESFAEIFEGNCLALGLPAVTLPASQILELLALVEENPQVQFVLDVSARSLVYQDGSGSKQLDIIINDTIRQSLLSGTWDSTSSLLVNQQRIREVAGSLPYINNFSQ